MPRERPDMPDTRPVVFITGASAGIGAETARQAARAGWDVAIGFRSDLDGARAVARDVTAAGGQAWLMQGDLSDPAGIERVWAELDASVPRLAALVNNAGIVDDVARVDEIGAPRLRRMLDTNLVGPFLMAGHAVRRMSTRHGGQGGVIVNVSSGAATNGSPGQYVDYAVSKGGLDTLTRGLGLEVAGEGVRVVGVRPGVVDTGIHAKGGQPDKARESAARIPLGRAGRPQEIAGTILFLLSDAAGFMTATTVDATGGR